MSRVSTIKMLTHKNIPAIAIAAVAFAVFAGVAIAAQDRYTLKVPGGLAFSEFKGYESWETIAISQGESVIASILGNPKMIEAYKSGIPGNGEPFPDGAMMAKVHWAPKKAAAYPGNPTVPGAQLNVDFMRKESERFADGDGWRYAVFENDAESDTWEPGKLSSGPTEGNDAK